MRSAEDAENKPLLAKAPTIVFDAETGLAVPMVGIWMVYLTIFMDTLASTISSPVLPYYARVFNATNAQIGYLFAAWSFTSTIFVPLLGTLADRIGRRTVLLLSLCGAAVAALGQGMATSYSVFFAMRALSGVWAAVGSSAQVYLTDVCTPATLAVYMARLSAVPSAAMIFGPGLGGGLSKFGLNVPILTDGCICLAAAVLVYVYLPESPAWKAGAKNGKGSTGAPARPVAYQTYILGLSQMLNGIMFSTQVSMLAIALDAKYGFTSLQVGYLFVAMALVMISVSIWGTTRLQQMFGLYNVAIGGTVIGALFMTAAMALTDSMWASIVCLGISRLGMTLRMSSGGAISALFAHPTNRGSTFARLQMMGNLGRFIGPLVAGHLAVADPIKTPWVFAGACGLLSAAVLLVAQPPVQEEPAEPQRFIRGFTDLHEADAVLEDEVGTAHDYEQLGRYVGQLLTRRHYRWVSHRQSVYAMLDQLLPELSTDTPEHMADLQRLMKHATDMQRNFTKIDSRPF